VLFVDFVDFCSGFIDVLPYQEKNVTVRLIEIPQDLPGFDQFIGAWACTGPLNFLVDVGPAGSAGHLIASLEALGMNRVDYILLTHIHIDHAGGLSRVLSQYPMANVICHEKAIPLLTDPSKLWTGSLTVLGDTARMYGEPKPVAKERLIPHTRCNLPGLGVIDTPGHAAHHLSFTWEDRLFVGEAGGNFMALDGGTYLRPATPPRFFMEAFLSSLEKLLALENRTLCYGHFGEAENSRNMLQRFRRQLLRWKDIILAELRKGEKDLVSRCMAVLLKKDPELARFADMAPAFQDRERFFLTNSINGFIGYLKEFEKRSSGSP
jgi:glyoxylase-like metal-dependent hydrolase (beta-lactamase superfamily II)